MDIEAFEITESRPVPVGPHIVWEPARFLDAAGNLQRETRGARLYLRDHGRVLAVAEVEGSRRSVMDAADAEAEMMISWLPVMTLLADAVARERVADDLELQIGQLLYHWDASQEWDLPAEDSDYERDLAYQYEERVRKIVPLEDQKRLRLPAAAKLHAARLRLAAAGLRVRAVGVMPDPCVGRPGVAWVGPYSILRRRDLKDGGTLDADLPHQLLMGWKRFDAEAEWQRDERDARRDALIRWAHRHGLPKISMAEASGVARTTIDRILSK